MNGGKEVKHDNKHEHHGATVVPNINKASTNQKMMGLKSGSSTLDALFDGVSSKRPQHDNHDNKSSGVSHSASEALQTHGDVLSGESGNGVVHSRSLEGIESVGGQGSGMSNFSDVDGADGDDTSESGGEHPLTQNTASF